MALRQSFRLHRHEKEHNTKNDGMPYFVLCHIQTEKKLFKIHLIFKHVGTNCINF